MTYTAEATLAAAAQWVGYHEASDGTTPFGYQWGFPDGAFCGMACQTWTVEAGGIVNNDPTIGTVPHTEYTVTGVELWQAWGRWHWADEEPEIGDFVYFRWFNSRSNDPYHHVGLTRAKNDWPYALGTTEANIDNSVLNLTRPNDGQIIGFGRPRYGLTVPTIITPPIQEDPMIVLTNAKGWHAVLGDRLIPVGGDKHFRPHDKTQVTFVAVSDKQLAGIKAKFAR